MDDFGIHLESQRYGYFFNISNKIWIMSEPVMLHLSHKIFISGLECQNIFYLFIILGSTSITEVIFGNFFF